MSWRVTADPDRFEEALDWFRGRLPITDELMELLGDALERRAFRVAGVAQLDIVQAVYDILLEVLRNGEGLDDFKRRAKEKLNGWAKDGARLELVYRTNVQSVYNAGRWRQMQDPAIVRFRPFYLFDAVLDSRTSEACSDRNGTVLPRSDPWWSENHPPIHHRCRSALRALTRKQAEARGITPPEDLVDLPRPGDGFGAIPTEDDWRPDDSKYSPELWAVFTDKQSELNE